MKKRIVFQLIVALCTMLPLVVWGQSSKMLKGDEFYEAGGYSEALVLYRNNLETVPKDQLGDYLFKVAECYRRTGNVRQAELWYKKAIMRDCSDPRAHLYYAQALLTNESYDLAKEEFQAYKELSPNDGLGDNGLKSVELAMAWKASPSGYTVQEMPVVNSKQEDYCPMYGSSDYRTLLFTSSREGATGKETHAATGQKFADIFVSLSNGEGRWGKPRLLRGNINTPFEEGTPNVSYDFTKLYFTRCRVAKQGKMGCQIFEAPQTGEGWDNAKVIPIAADSMIVAHPAISKDGLTLYFSSDLPGGFGGLDIWKVTRAAEGDSWGEPVNLGGAINTAGNEVFPYAHPDGTLYFSSNGLPGMGGLDIFKAKLQDNGQWEVENMRYPINSPADDFGITFKHDIEEGFFTSRRKGGRGGDDIYWFYLPRLEFNLIGEITDDETQKPIAKAQVRLVGSDGSIQNGETGSDGSFRFMLKPNTDYVAVTTEKGYLNGKLKASTKGKSVSEDIRKTVTMVSHAKPIVLPNIFYDFDRWELRPESKGALDMLVEILNDNPSIVIELGSHTDSRGSLEYNRELSQKRAQSVVNYLIKNGIPAERLLAKGYAQTEPFVVDEYLSGQYDYLPVGQQLTDDFISTLADDTQRETANQANRRTEFRVVRNDYVTTGAQ